MKTPKPLPAAEAHRFARARKRFESIDAEVQRQVAATLELRRVPTKRERLEKLENEMEKLQQRVVELEADVVGRQSYRVGT